MPKRSSSRERTWVIILWLFLGACIWTGCGPGRTLPLVNGYECYIDSAFIMISFPDSVSTDGAAIGDAGEFDQVDDMLFGTRVEWNSDEVIGYFIIDTLTHDLQLFKTRQEWLASLQQMDLNAENVRWPGVFFHGVGWPGYVCSGLLILFPVLFLIYGVQSLSHRKM